MNREALLSDDQWDLIEPLLPPQRPARGRPMRDHRQVVEGVIYRYRCGIAWRDLPSSFGPWQTVWKRHRRFSGDGTWDKILAAVLAQADAAEKIDWSVSVDSTINRAHQHGTNLPREPRSEPTADASAAAPDPAAPDPGEAPVPAIPRAQVVEVCDLLTGGWVESQEIRRSRCSTRR